MALTSCQGFGGVTKARTDFWKLLLLKQTINDQCKYTVICENQKLRVVTTSAVHPVSHRYAANVPEPLHRVSYPGHQANWINLKHLQQHAAQMRADGLLLPAATPAAHGLMITLLSVCQHLRQQCHCCQVH
jgi:hypothetical protein